MQLPPGSISSDSPALTAWVEQTCGGTPSVGSEQPSAPTMIIPAPNVRDNPNPTLWRMEMK
jgi:hypothetical protein